MSRRLFPLILAILVIQLVAAPISSSIYIPGAKSTNAINLIEQIIRSASMRRFEPILQQSSPAMPSAMNYDWGRYNDKVFQALLAEAKGLKVYPIVAGDKVIDYVTVPDYDSIEPRYYIDWNIIRQVDRNANKLHDKLEEQMKNEDEEIVVIVLLTTDDREAIEKFKSMGGIVTSVWEHAVKGFAGKIKAKYIPILAKHPTIAIIEPDFEVKYTLVFSTKTIGANRVWGTLINSIGIPSARDFSIAILDTGVSANHPMTNGWSSAATNPAVWNDDTYKVVGWSDQVGTTTSPVDDNGHGSHCAGIAVGSNVSVTAVDSQGRLVFTDGLGIRYDASLLGSGTFYPGFSFYVYIPDVNSEVEIEWPRFRAIVSTGNSANVNATVIYRPDGTLAAVIYDNGAGDLNTNTNQMLVRFRPIDYGVTQPGIWRFVWRLRWVVTRTTNAYVGSAYRVYVHVYYPSGEYGIISGVAPRTKLVGIKVLNNVGNGTSTGIVNGINWAITNRDTYRIVAASMSFGSGAGYVSATINSAVINLVKNGIVAVAAAGNEGPDSNTISGSPGLSDAAITVAAATSGTSGSVRITSYSSRGPGSGSTLGNTTKPDIAAVGGESDGTVMSIDTTYDDEVEIYSVSSTGSVTVSKSAYGWTERYTYDLAIFEGTSMATPHVTGAVALLISALYGGWANWPKTAAAAAQIKAILCATAWEIATKNRGGKDPEEGFGLLQIDAAVDAVTKEYTIGTYVAEGLYSDPFSRHVWARKVYLTAGHTYTFELTVPGTADFDIYLWAWDPKPATTSPYGTWGEPLLVAWSNVTSEGGDEAIVYTPSTSGWYILTIKQISGYGAFQLESYEQINPPTCTITSPTTGSTVSGTITVQVSASDVSPGYVTSVTLYIDGGSPRSMTYNSATGKWEASVDTTALSEGQHVLRAKAVDNEGNFGWSNIVEIFVDNYPAKVLLVDDDAGASYEAYYKKALEDLAIDYDYYSVPSGANGPGTTVLGSYPFVIWFTGDDYQTTLTTTDQTNLGTYLSGGKKLFISGQDIGYDLGAGNSFMNTYLAANYVGDSAASSTVIGQTGTVFYGVTYYLSGGDGANNNAAPDYVNLYDAPGTEAIALKYHNGLNAAIVHDSGTYRTVYFAFPFEAINSRDARKDAMKRTLIYLGYDIPPEVVIVSPPPDVGTNTGSITVVWNATDDYDIASHAVYLDGNLIATIDESGTQTSVQRSYTITGLSDGLHTVRIRVADSAGQYAYKEVTFWADSTPPTVSITSPPSGTWYTTPAITIQWSASDNFELDHHEIRVVGGSYDSGWINVGLNTSYTITLPTDGSYTVTVKTYDRATNTATSTVTIGLDRIPPTVSIESPSSGTWLNTRDVTVTWSGSDSLSGIDHYEIRIDGGSWINVGTSTSYTFTNLAEGTHTVEVKAVDKVGNTATSTVTVGVDVTPPTVSVTSPPSGTWYNTRDVTVTWSGSDSLSGIHHYEIRINGGSWINVGTSTSYTFTNLAEGTHTIEVKAVDMAGNTATSTITVGVDVTPPTVSITSPQNGSTTSSNTVTVEWSGSDALSGINHYEVRCYNSTWDSGWINVGTSTSYTFANLAGGDYTVEVRAYDNVGNAKVTYVTFSIGVFRIVNPGRDPSTQAAYVASNTATISWTSTSANYYEIYVNGTYIGSTTSTSYTLSLSEGIYNITVVAMGSTGSIGQDSLIIVIDLTPPALTLQTTTLIANSQTTQVSVAWSGNDALSGIDHYEIGIGSSWINIGSSTSYTIDTGTLSEGRYTIYVRAFDRSGNYKQSYAILIVDRTAPTITVSYPSDGAVLSTGDITVSWTGSDSSGIAYYEVKVDSGQFIRVGKATSYYLSLGEGIHTITIRAYDTLRNYAEVTITIKVDLTPPDLEITSPADGAIIASGTVAVTWSSSSTDIAYYLVRLDSGEWIKTTTTSYTFTGLLDGPHVVYVTAVDTAGHRTLRTVIFVVVISGSSVPEPEAPTFEKPNLETTIIEDITTTEGDSTALITTENEAPKITEATHSEVVEIKYITEKPASINETTKKITTLTPIDYREKHRETYQAETIQTNSIRIPVIRDSAKSHSTMIVKILVLAYSPYLTKPPR